MWPNQSWFPLLMVLLTSKILDFGPYSNLLSCPPRKKHPLAKKLILKAGRLSGKHLLGKEYQTHIYQRSSFH